MAEKTSKRKAKPTPKPKAPSKQIKANIASLGAYTSNDPTLEVFNQLIKLKYEDRSITQIRTAKAAQNLIKTDNLKEFRKKFANIVKLDTKNLRKKQAVRDVKNRAEKEETDKKVREIERVVYKPNLITRKQETEAPSYEVEYKRDYTNFTEAWEAGNKSLIRMIERHITKKPNIKIYVGLKYQVVKTTIDADNEDPDTVEAVQSPPKKGACKTSAVSIYNAVSVKPSINSLKGELEHKFQKSLEQLTGSNWSIKRFDSLFAVAHTLPAARKGGSYLETPVQFANPKCG
jgi:hypothetical protein